MAADLDGKRILIVATHGFEQSELEVPYDKLKAAGAEVHVAAPKAGTITGWTRAIGAAPRSSTRSSNEGKHRRKAA